MPTVSVVIPTHNRSNYLKRAIDSVLGQSFQDFELIIVDDNSDDDTEDVVHSYSDKRIKYLKNTKNLKATKSRNIGICNAKGKYIALLDDDDYWYPHKLEKQIDKIFQSNKNLGFVYSGFSIVLQKNNTIFMNIYPQKKGKVFKDIINFNILGSPTPLIRKDLLLRAGLFDNSFKSAQDWDLWIRLSMLTEFDYVDEILACYVIHENQISTGLLNKIESISMIINKYKYYYEKDPYALASQYKKMAALYMVTNRVKDSQIYAYKAYVQSLFRYDTFAHLLFSLSPKFYKYYIKNKLCTYYNDSTQAMILY